LKNGTIWHPSFSLSEKGASPSKTGRLVSLVYRKQICWESNSGQFVEVLTFVSVISYFKQAILLLKPFFYHA
jgi:hypothetical protein